MLSQLLASYSDFKQSELPEDVIEKTKWCVVDWLGCALGGLDLPSTQVMFSLASEIGGQTECTLLNSGLKVSAPVAALANGTAGHGLEMDDVNNEASLHAGAAVIPAALALAEKEKVSGKAFLSAIIAGYEVTVRIGKAIGPASHLSQGFHPTATCGTFGATVTAGKIIGLSREQMVSGLGIAGSFTSGNLECYTDGTWTKKMQPGIAAHNGVISALLAQKGYLGPASILEGKRGFLQGYSQEANPALITEGLGSNFAVLRTSFKPYPSCRFSQSAIDLALEFFVQEQLKAQEITEILVGLPGPAIPIVAEPYEQKINPANQTDAQFSVQYCVAAALVHGRLTLDEFTPESLTDLRIRSLLGKIKCYHNQELDRYFPSFFPAIMQIKTADSRLLMKKTIACKGDPEKELTPMEIDSKFRTLAGKVMDKERIEKIIGLLKAIDTLPNLLPLIESLK